MPPPTFRHFCTGLAVCLDISCATLGEALRHSTIHDLSMSDLLGKILRHITHRPLGQRTSLLLHFQPRVLDPSTFSTLVWRIRPPAQHFFRHDISASVQSYSILGINHYKIGNTSSPLRSIQPWNLCISMYQYHWLGSYRGWNSNEERAAAGRHSDLRLGLAKHIQHGTTRCHWCPGFCSRNRKKESRSLDWGP